MLLLISVTDADGVHLLRAAHLADLASGQAAPHPRSGCVLVDARGTVVAEAFQLGQGGERAEVLAARLAGWKVAGGTGISRHAAQKTAEISLQHI